MGNIPNLHKRLQAIGVITPAGRVVIPEETFSKIDQLVEEYHAVLYPEGCRGTWATMCESCCARLGGRV